MLHLYIFIYLLLVHLLADFVFQPEALVAWKHKSWKGIFVHVFILFVMSLAFFWPIVATINVFGAGVLLANAGLHFLMDKDKIRMEKKGKHHFVQLFFLDQLFHVAVLGVVTYFLAYCLQSDPRTMGKLVGFFGSFLPFAVYVIVAILSTYVYEIVTFQFKREKGKAAASLKFNYQHMFIRLMILSLIFGFALFFSGFDIAKTFLVGAGV